MANSGGGSIIREPVEQAANVLVTVTYEMSHQCID